MGRPKDERGISGRANIFIAGGEGGKKGVEVDSAAAAEVVPLFALYLGGWVGSVRPAFCLSWPQISNGQKCHRIDRGHWLPLQGRPQKCWCNYSEVFCITDSTRCQGRSAAHKILRTHHPVAVGRQFYKMVFAARAWTVSSSSSLAVFQFLR